MYLAFVSSVQQNKIQLLWPFFTRKVSDLDDDAFPISMAFCPLRRKIKGNNYRPRSIFRKKVVYHTAGQMTGTRIFEHF